MKTTKTHFSSTRTRQSGGSKLWCALAAVILALHASGCGGGGEDPIPKPNSDAASEARLDITAFDVQLLLDHENPLVANNAVLLKSSFEANDYARATTALQGIISAKVEDQATRDAIRAALLQVRDVVQAAVENGDPNAQYALDRLMESFGD